MKRKSNHTIAAFWWDIKKCIICYLIIDNDMTVLSKPKKYHLDFSHFDKFKNKSKKAIQSFYRQIRMINTNHHTSKIIIEYKILHEVEPELATHYEADSKSIYVKRMFMQEYALNKAKILSMKLSQQLRARLKNPALKTFKTTLREVKLVKPNRYNHYEYTLWMLALHATKSNYQKIIKKIYANDAVMESRLKKLTNENL